MSHATTGNTGQGNVATATLPVYVGNTPSSSSPDIPLTETPPVWTSPSFWVTLLPTLTAVLGYFLHQQIDLSGQAAAIGLIGASLASGLLAIARSMRHQAVLAANAHAQSMRLGHAEAMMPDRTYARDEDVHVAFSDVAEDMRAHDARLKKLERTLTDNVIPARVAAKKTAAKKRTAPRKRTQQPPI